MSTRENPGPANFMVLCAYGKSPHAVYAGGLYEFEAIILQRCAVRLGYTDAKITTKEGFQQTRGVEQERQRVARESNLSDRLLHDLPPLTHIPLAR